MPVLAVTLQDKVLVPTQSTVAGLLTDSSVPGEAKEKLAAFARKSANEKLSLEKVD